MHTCPLEVYTVIGVNLEFVGDEVVLHRWVHLDDVSSLPTDIEVVDASSSCLFVGDAGAWAEHHHVGPVLEGAAKLGSVDGQSEWLVGGGADVDIGVLLNRGATAGSAEEERGRRDKES